MMDLLSANTYAYGRMRNTINIPKNKQLTYK